MNPCKECVKVYKQTPCDSLKHCAFEGTNEKPFSEIKIITPIVEQRQVF